MAPPCGWLRPSRRVDTCSGRLISSTAASPPPDTLNRTDHTFGTQDYKKAQFPSPQETSERTCPIYVTYCLETFYPFRSNFYTFRRNLGRGHVRSI